MSGLVWLGQVRVNEQQVVLWKALITGAPAPCSFGRGAAHGGVITWQHACQQLTAVRGFSAGAQASCFRSRHRCFR